MDITGLLLFLVIGAIAGWIAGELTKGSGFGLLGNIIVGVVGALLGGLIFDALNVGAAGLLGSLVTAVVGAVVLLFLLGLVNRPVR